MKQCFRSNHDKNLQICFFWVKRRQIKKKQKKKQQKTNKQKNKTKKNKTKKKNTTDFLKYVESRVSTFSFARCWFLQKYPPLDNFVLVLFLSLSPTRTNTPFSVVNYPFWKQYCFRLPVWYFILFISDEALGLLLLERKSHFRNLKV